jgi:hypothetical protein
MKKLLHFHLPKTGGTALREYVAAQVGVQNVSPGIVGVRLSDALARWQDLLVISGHFSLWPGDRLPGDRYNLTVLRDPVDRFLSEFSFIKHDNADRLLSPKVRMLGLDAYLESLSSRESEQANLQVSMLSSLGALMGSVGVSMSEKLKEATRALEDFEFVGVQEELSDLVCMLEARFSWQPITLSRSNITHQRLNKQDLMPSQKRILEAILAAEIELYEGARARFLADRRNAIRQTVISASSAISQAAPLENERAQRTGQKNASSTILGDRQCVITRVTATGQLSGLARAMTGERMVISVFFTAAAAVSAVTAAIAIRDEMGALVFGTNSRLLGFRYAISAGGYAVQYELLNRMARGNYTIDVSLTRNGHRHESCYQWLGSAATLEVYDSAVNHFEGLILMDPQVEILGLSPEASFEYLPVETVDFPLRSLGRLSGPLKEFSSKITALASTDLMYLGMEVLLPLRIENTGNEEWPAFGKNPVVVSYRWLTSDGEVIVFDGLRTKLPADISPDDAVIVPLTVKVPATQGNLQLLISLVQEGVAWFCDEGENSSLALYVTL